MSDDFYVTLISIAPSRYEETNTTSSFRTDLYSELPINNGQFEVALTEVLYIHSWRINAGKLSYKFNDVTTFINIYILDGETISTFLKRLNTQISEIIGKKIYDERLKVYQEETLKPDNQAKLKEMRGKYPTNKFELALDRDIISDIKKTEGEFVEAPKFFLDAGNIYLGIYNKVELQIFGVLNSILNSNNTDNVSKTYKKETESNGKEQINNETIFSETEPIQITQKLYFYTDFISHQFVSNIKTPLLRSIVIDYHTDYKIKASHFDSPYYLKINKTSINSLITLFFFISMFAYLFNI
jgi:hypothetical protein